jgi:hypothetical protein
MDYNNFSVCNCPFCGATSKDTIGNTNTLHVIPVATQFEGVHTLTCSRCGATGPKAYGDRKSVELWNKREDKQVRDNEPSFNEMKTAVDLKIKDMYCDSRNDLYVAYLKDGWTVDGIIRVSVNTYYGLVNKIYNESKR